MFLKPTTVVEADLSPPAPEQVIEKELFPAVEIVTVSEPEVAVADVQLAEQEEALVDDQVKVEVSPNRTEVGSAVKLTFGAGVGGVLEPPPPPPPPPQDATNVITINVLSTFFINSIKLTYLEINSREIILKKELFYGGATRDRTADLLNAIQALSQLSYSPKVQIF